MTALLEAASGEASEASIFILNTNVPRRNCVYKSLMILVQVTNNKIQEFNFYLIDYGIFPLLCTKSLISKLVCCSGFGITADLHQ